MSHYSASANNVRLLEFLNLIPDSCQNLLPLRSIINLSPQNYELERFQLSPILILSSISINHC